MSNSYKNYDEDKETLNSECNINNENKEKKVKDDYIENRDSKELEEKQIKDIKDKNDSIEKINEFLREWRKPITGISLILCVLLSLNIVSDVLFSNKETKNLNKENTILQKEIDKLDEENKKLNQDIKELATKNNKAKELEEKAILESFKAVSGTTWGGIIEWNDNSQALNVSLDIKTEEIILNGINLQWDRLENEGEKFNPRILLATGEIEKENGYMKLNRISLQNSPEYTKEWDDECMPYDYELIVNNNYISGFVLDNSKVVGNIFLEKN